jgi:ComEC/Rec2-related protein
VFKKFIFSWDRFPALFIFASLLSGAILHLGMPFPLLLAFTHPKNSFKAGYILLAAFTALLFTLDQEEAPSIDKEYVTAYIEPLKIKESHHRLFLMAHCPYLITETGNEYKNIRLMIPIAKKMAASFNYNHIVSGVLKKSSYGYFLKGEKWEKKSPASSPISTRFMFHKKAKRFIKKKVKDLDVQAYFAALITGSIDDPFLRAKFLETGMLHTLAISGFHFSWIIFILSVPLSLIMKKKWSLLVLLFLSWCYFFFLGGSSSISRAWIAISVYILSILFSKIPLPLNALGLAGIISILVNPYSTFELSFALSFLATFAILTLFPLIGHIVNKISPKRPKDIRKQMPFMDKTAYYLLRFFLTSLSLSFLIQAALLPISIHFFPFISLWGLLYNIFIPISMVPTLLLILLAFLLYPILGSTLLWRINEAYSKPFLESILYGRGAAALLIKTPHISPYILSFTLCLLLLLCLKLESIFHEESLIRLDEFLLT